MAILDDESPASEEEIKISIDTKPILKPIEANKEPKYYEESKEYVTFGINREY